jgi:ABC-type glycerol-3-phosphate transport system substrate-binding protein
VLDYYKKLMQFLPPDVPSWDDASNNKFLVSGQGTLIMNPPSAWAVAKRDAPQVAEQLWTHGFPAGPRAASHRSCRTSGASGTSARTSRRPRA